jgi:hypothetical protein
MKKLLFIPLLFLFVISEAQFTKSGGFLKTGSSFMTAQTSEEGEGGYTDKYTTLLAAYTTVPHDTIKTKQNALIYSLDSAGYWDRMDVLYVFANDDGTDALINWINPGTFNADNVHSTAFTAWQGFTGDGSNDYISTNYIPSSDGTNYIQNSGSVGIYIRSNIAEGYNVFGAHETAPTAIDTYLNPYDETPGWHLSRLNDASNTSGAQINANTSMGLWILSRNASNSVKIYWKNSQEDSETDASTGVNTIEFWILGANPAYNSYSSHEVSIFFIMNGIADATEAGKINTIIERYMDSLYKGVE